MKTFLKRRVAVLLMVCMICSMLPLNVWAAGGEETGTTVYDEEESTMEETEAVDQEQPETLYADASLQNVSVQVMNYSDEETENDGKENRSGLVASGFCGDNLTWNLENGVLTISGTGEMMAYGPTFSTPWAGMTVNKVVINDGVLNIGDYAFHGCSCLSSITIPDSVTSIGENAFSRCSSLSSLTIPDSVTIIGSFAFDSCSSLRSTTVPEGVTCIAYRTFCSCSSLSSITIPESVTSIGNYAFAGCSSLKNVCYGGTEEQWNAIDKDGCEIRGTIHFNAKSPATGSVSIEPMVDTITRSRGDVYLPVLVLLQNGEPVPDNTKVVWSYDGKRGHGYPENGVLRIPINGTSGQHTVYFKSISGGLTLATDSVSVTVEKTDETYTEKLDMKLNLEFKAKLAKLLGVSAKNSEGLSIFYQENGDGTSKLTLSNTVTGKGNLSGTLSGKAGSYVSALKGSGYLSAQTTTTMTIDNFDTNLNDDEQQALIGYFMLRTLNLQIGNVTLAELQKQFYDIYGTLPIEVEETKASAEVDVRANHNIKMNLGELGEYKLTAANVGTRFGTEGKFKTGSRTYSTFVESDRAGFLLEGPWLLGVKSSIFGSGLSKNTAKISVQCDHNDNVKSLTASSVQKDYDEVISSSASIAKTTTVKYSGTAAEDIVESNSKLRSLGNGQYPLFSQSDIGEAYKAMNQSDDIAAYEETLTYGDKFEYDLDAGLISASASGEKSYDFTSRTGVVYMGQEYLTMDAESMYTEGNTWDLGYSGPAMVALGINGLNSFLGDVIEFKVGQVVDGVKDTAASIWGGLTDWSASLFHVGGTSNYSIDTTVVYAAENDQGDSVSVTTIGQPYTIRVFTDDTSTTEVSAEELSKHPVYIEMYYSEEDLMEAGITADQIEHIGIYHWDVTRGVYRQVDDCEIDYEAMSVVASVWENGEYVLALDCAAPTVESFNVSDGTASPKIVAVMDDFSDIDCIILSVDGDVVLDAENFDDYYDATNGVLSYDVSEPLSEGEHTVSLMVTDTSGNSLDETQSITWWVDTTPPEITEVQLPSEVEAGQSLVICASIDSQDTAWVYAQIENDTGSYIVDMALEDQDWETKLDFVGETEKLSVTVFAMDEYGNLSSSSPYTVSVQKHTWDQGVITSAASCTVRGIKTYTCETCGMTTVEYVPETDHSFGQGTITTAPTCTEQGEKTFICECGETKTETVPATGHKYESKVVKPTCTEKGYTLHTCKNCGDSYKDTYTKATGHKWDSGKVTTKATCTKNGVKTYTCQNCGKTKTEKIAATGHKYESKVVKPTCTEKGYSLHTCKNCGDSYKDTYTNATGHKWDSGKVTTKATCTKDGVKTYTCQNCGEKKIEKVAATGHSYETKVVKPTCTEKSYTLHTCKNCSDSYKDTYVDATGHNWDKGTVTKAPTATEKGVKTYTCKTCGKTKTEEIAKLSNPFTDLKNPSSYYDAVLWAVDKGITKGTSATEFSPKADCTRAQIVTFLWRYAGEPEPTTTKHKFVDIVEGSSYYKAVLWAVEKGITNGLDETHFGPKEPCTRAQIVTFLWRAAGKPQPSSQKHSFTDIVKGSSYYDAVLWAVEKGITTGADSTHFAPKDTCTRAQGMTFLYRYNNTK